MADNASVELEDLSASRLIDGTYAFENKMFSSVFSSEISNDLREEYFSQLRKSTEFIQCPKHPGEEIRFFCRDCSDRVCSHCLILHSEHDIITHTTAVNDKLDNLLGSISQFNDILESLQMAKRIAEDKRKTLQQKKDILSGEIESYFDELQQKLNQMKIQLQSELEDVSEKYTSKCDDVISSWESYESDIAHYASLKDSVRHKLLEQDLFPLEEVVRRQLTTFKKTMPPLDPPESISLEVVWDGQTKDMLASCERVAEIKSDSVREVNNLLTEFNVRHLNDKGPTCIDSIVPLNSQQVAMVDIGNSKVKVFSVNGKPAMCFVGGGRYHMTSPCDILVLGSGKMLVSDPGSQKVVLFNENGIGAHIFGVDACGAMCIASALFPATQSAQNHFEADVLVMNSVRKRIEILHVKDKKLSKVRTDIELQHENLLTNPRYMVVNPINKYICVSDPDEHCLLMFSIEGKLLRKYGRLGQGFGECNAPGAVVCDAEGHILLADTLNHRVHLLDAEGNFIKYFLTHSNKLRFPRAMVLNNDGHVWIVQHDAIVKKFAYRSDMILSD